MTIGDARSEFELKLEFDEEELARLAGSPALAALTVGEPRKGQLVSTYYDTPDLRLRDAGMSLRIRESGGALIQTAKIGTHVSGGIANPLESEAPAIRRRPHPAAIPDEAVRDRIAGTVDFRALRPVFRTDIERTRRIVELDGARAELALDAGHAIAGRRSARVCEAELEHLAGDAAAFLALAETLFAGRRLRFARLSKSARGYALIDGKVDRHEPRFAAEVELDPAMDGVACLRTCAAEAVEQILVNGNGVLESDRPEFTHQLRVGLRRLRSALRLCRPACDGDELRGLSRELGEIGRVVGRLRNCDVLAAEVVRPALADEGEPAAGEIRRTLDARCRHEREAARAALAAPALNRLLLRLALLPHGLHRADGAPAMTGAELARIALRRAWKKARALGQRLDALDTEERHLLRKEMKVLRYGLEFFAPLLPARRTSALLRRLKALQDGLGYLNDVALATALPAMLPGDAGDDPQIQRCVGKVIGWHEALAQREWSLARERWAELETQPKPWR